MSEAPEKGDPRQEPIYRAILAVLVASVLAGAVLTVGAEALFGSPALADAGFGMAVVCGVLYWVFRILGKRASARGGKRASTRVARHAAQRDGKRDED